eukprot:11224126-Lingulodinium_polyedra.AAC.1
MSFCPPRSSLCHGTSGRARRSSGQCAFVGLLPGIILARGVGRGVEVALGRFHPVLVVLVEVAKEAIHIGDRGAFRTVVGGVFG